MSDCAWSARVYFDRPLPDPLCEINGTSPDLDVARTSQLLVALEGNVDAGPASAASVLDALRRAGLAGLRMMRGRFSVLICDRSAREVVAVRDPLGARPLFHHRTGGEMVISQSLAATLGAPPPSGVDRIGAVAQGLLGLPSHRDETFFPNVRRIPAGHYLRATPDRMEVRRWWSPEPPSVEPARIDAEFAARLDTAMERGCPKEGMAVMLSGGLDSALVATAAARHSRRAGWPPPVALSVVNPTPETDESEMQTRVAGLLDMPLRAARLGAPDSRGVLVASLELTARSAWPAGTTMGVMHALARDAVQAGAGTVVTGDGGDELLMPFTSWALDAVLTANARGLRDYATALRYVYPDFDRPTVRRRLLWDWSIRPLVRHPIAAALAAGRPKWWRDRRRRGLPAHLPQWLLPDAADRSELASWWLERSPMVPPIGRHRREKLEVLDASYTSLLMEDHHETGLRLGAKMTSPLWDVDVVELLLAVPPACLVAGGKAKALARRYIERDLPFADRWPPKAFADGVIRHLMRREARAAFDHLGGVPLLDGLGVVDGALVERRIEETTRERNAVDASLLWDVMALEAFLRSRTLAER